MNSLEGGTLIIRARCTDGVILAADRRHHSISGSTIADGHEKIARLSPVFVAGHSGLSTVVATLMGGVRVTRLDIPNEIASYAKQNPIDFSNVYWDGLGAHLHAKLITVSDVLGGLIRTNADPTSIFTVSGVAADRGKARFFDFNFSFRRSTNQLFSQWGFVDSVPTNDAVVNVSGDGGTPVERLLKETNEEYASVRSEAEVHAWIEGIRNRKAPQRSAGDAATFVRRLFAHAYAELGPKGAISQEVDVALVRGDGSMEWIHRG